MNQSTRNMIRHMDFTAKEYSKKAMEESKSIDKLLHELQDVQKKLKTR